jgi:myosin-crossreactive antigen
MNLEQAEQIETYIVGTFILALIAAIVYLAREVQKKDKEIKALSELTSKCMELIGTNTEVIRGAVSLINKLHEKL